MKTFLTLFVLLFSSSVYSYTALGHSKCGDVLAAHDKKNNVAKFQLIDWLNGYITGRNAENNSQNGKGVGDEGIYYEAINLCKKSPLSTIPIIALELYEKLKYNPS